MNTSQYNLLENFKRIGCFEHFESDTQFNQLISEVKALRRKLMLLPTIRETEALSDLVLVNQLLSVLISHQRPLIEQQLDTHSKLEKLFLGDLVEGVCGDILRAKIYSNKEIVRVADEIFQKAVAFSASRLSKERQSDFAILSLLLDKNNDFYKNNGTQSNFYEYPFGDQLQANQETLAWLSQLKKGDVVAEYIGE